MTLVCQSVSFLEIPTKGHSLMIPAEVSQYLTSEYGLTRSEALFTAKLVEGKSIIVAGEECSMTLREAHTALNRVLLKIPSLFPSCSRRYRASNSDARLSARHETEASNAVYGSH
jgi:hypothetical protein